MNLRGRAASDTQRSRIERSHGWQAAQRTAGVAALCDYCERLTPPPMVRSPNDSLARGVHCIRRRMGAEEPV